jgi:hypothetical protein
MFPFNKTKSHNPAVEKEVEPSQALLTTAGTPINTVYSNEVGRNPINFLKNDRRKRGIQVYSTSQIMSTTGRDKDGFLLTWGTEQPYFYLTAEQRNAMFRLSSMIFGIVSSRMNKISQVDYNVVSIQKVEDQAADEMKELRAIYMEYIDSIEMPHLVLKARILKSLLKSMPLLKRDLSNFDSCLLRWKRSIQRKNEYTSNEIKEWLMQPNQGTNWESYIKKVVYNLHIHGCEATYKQFNDGRLENFDSLVGGTVFKLKKAYFSTLSGFIQVISGFEPQVFFPDEICFMDYLPTSVQSQSMIPLEALINIISEHLLFDGLMAEWADGTKPPEKMVLITDNSPFGSPDQDQEFSVGMNPEEQKRIETKLNEPRKNAIMTFSGNNVEVVDLSRSSTMEFQNNRKKDIREECALVFNMTNMEVNLTGSEGTSGRATSETQAEIEQGKGTGPILKMIQNHITHDILPFRFGNGWMIEFMKSKNEMEERQLDLIKLQTGELTENELRESRGKPLFMDQKYNIPKDSAQGSPGENSVSPQYMKMVE